MTYSIALEKTAFAIIDCWLNHFIRFSSFPGIQICVRNKADIIFHKAYGYANRSQWQTLTTDHLFHIASHSKSITACMILQLVEQGRLHFDDVIVDHVPELRHHSDVRFREITLRDLLTQRSGIFRDSNDAGFWRFSKPFLNREELFKNIQGAALIYQPNTQTKYSNIGYALLGVIIENITGISYAHAANQLIISKLQLSNIFTDYSEVIASRMALGHLKSLEGAHNIIFKHEPTHALAPATGFCANAADINLFMYEMLQGDKLLSKKMQREVLSLNWPVANSDAHERYGLGLQFEIYDKNHFVGHTGGYPGFTTLTFRWVNTPYTISVLNNSTESAHLIGILRSLAEIMQILSTTFDEDDLQKLIITSPFMTPWDSGVFALTPQKGLVLSFKSNRLCHNALKLDAGEHKDTYICSKENGYASWGEVITVQRNEIGEINSVKWGGEEILCTDDFLNHVQTYMI